MITYEGHGQTGTGNWCFHDGTLGIEDIEKMVVDQYPLIIADCCFSGHWAWYCRKKDSNLHFHTLSASPQYSVAYDNPSMYSILYYLVISSYYQIREESSLRG